MIPNAGVVKTQAANIIYREEALGKIAFLMILKVLIR
jgi:hypothetical protein